MRYPYNVKPDGKYFLVTFPDIPEAITQGESMEQVFAVVQDALETALEFYFEGSRAVPEPSPIKRGGHFVELPPSLTAKILLLNEMIHQHVRPAELARRLGTTPQAVNRLTNLRHASKIDGIAGAMKALGKTLEIRAA
jgi:antitoxin HicB